MGTDPIQIIGRDYEDDYEPVRSWGWLVRRSTVEPDALQQSLKKFVSSIESVLEGIPTALGGYDIDELEIGVEVSAKGTVSLLGSGGEMSGKGGMTIRLKRRAS